MNIKYIGMDIHKETISIGGDERRGKSGDGVDHRTQDEHHPAVYPDSNLEGTAPCRPVTKGRSPSTLIGLEAFRLLVVPLDCRQNLGILDPLRSSVLCSRRDAKIKTIDLATIVARKVTHVEQFAP